MVILSNKRPLKSYQLALPSLMAEDFVRIQEFDTVKLCTGPVDVLGQIASSPVLMMHLVITVLLESSISIPSLFGVLKSPKIDRPSIDVLSHLTMCKL